MFELSSFEWIRLHPWLFAIILNSILWLFAALLPKKLLTPAGYVHAWILGVLVWGCLGWQGYTIVMFYFLFGSTVTRIGKAQKEAAGIAEKRDGARGPENVWGSALTGTLCAIALAGYAQLQRVPTHPLPAVPPLLIILLQLGYVASFATKLADTTASEVGKAYGKRTFLITSLQPVPAGTEGAVSLEGTLAGLVGAVAIALLGYGLEMIDSIGMLWCILAAFIATNIESLIGATLQEQLDWMTNEVVNFINTAIGAILAILFGWGWAWLLIVNG